MGDNLGGRPTDDRASGDRHPAESGSSTFADVERWAADARARQAADSRARERWLRRQAHEEASLVALLLDLAERGTTVIATADGGRRHVGRVEAVGEDFAALRAAGDRTTLVALASVVAVSTPGGRPLAPSSPAGRDGERPVRATLAEVLGYAAGSRRRVQLHAGEATVVGELVSVGADLVVLAADGDPPAAVYMRLASVSEASLLDSG